MKAGKAINPATNRVGLGDVQVGDVLLSRGWGNLSNVICLLDGGKYSHSGICVGFDDDGMPLIVQATKQGVAVRRLKDDLAAQRYIHLYRFKSDTNETFLSPDWPPWPVINKANEYESNGTKYAYDQLLLLGIIVLARRAPVGKLGQARIRLWLDQFAEHYRAHATSKKEEVTCSELIYRCFYEADAKPPGKYGLTIRRAIGPGGHLIKAFTAGTVPPQIKLDPATVNAYKKAAKVLGEIKPVFNPQILQPSGAIRHIRILAANPNICADMVTPYDMQHSSNLRFIGKFKRKIVTSWAKHVITCMCKSP